MEKQFSIDEVNNFLKRFKEKRGKKTIPNKTQSTQVISNKKTKEEENIFGSNTAVDNIFGTKDSEAPFKNNNYEKNDKNLEKKTNKIDNEKELNIKQNEKLNNKFSDKRENLNIFDSKENDVDLFNTNKETNSENLDLFNKNINNENKEEIENLFDNNKNEKEDLNFFNNINNNNEEDLFNSKPKSKLNENKIFKPKNVINNNTFNNFKTGIVLNNPLENEENNNYKENEAFNIFQGNDENNIDNYNNEDNKINNNLEYNNENIEQKEEENYISKNYIYYNNKDDDNNVNDINENNKEESNDNINENNNFYYERKDSNNEMEKLDEDQNNNQTNDNNINNYNQQTNNYNYLNNNEINNNYNQNSELKLNYNIDEKSTSSESYDYSSIEHNYVVLASNERKTISINNIYSMLNSSYENQLYENYFPVSYSKEPDLNKLINLLNIILNNENELNEPLGHIIAHIFKFIMESKLNLQKLNILQNIELKNIIIEILSKQIQKDNKGTISLNNLFNVETLFNQKNSNLNYDMANQGLIHPLEFMLNLFNEKILNKNNILYLYFILLNIKENDEFFNHGIGLDEYDYIFENFDCALFIILKYFGNDINKIKNICNILINSYSSKINFCQFVILKCLLGDFDVKNGKKYGNIFMNFLQFPTIEKILIADIYNFILFTASSKFKKVIAKSSILIKYKYSLIKQYNKPENNLLILNERIFENIHQFGSISKNSFFVNHLKDFSNKKLNISQKNISQKQSEENNIFQKNKEKNNIHKLEETQQQKGLFSKFINAFGFGGSETNNENQISEEDKKRMSPSELWKLEHPGQPEIEYDPVLKRYKLRGIIYNDQEEVIKKKEMEKPMVAPPKSKKYGEKKKNNAIENNDNINIENEINYNNNEEKGENIFQNKNSNLSGGPGNVNNRINNPFGYSQVKNLNNSKNIQKQNNHSLSQRYAVAYKK